jgi:Cdc6-like AAA superfamily ATPase
VAFRTLATRSGLPLKAMIDGPSGSGKTYTALEIATGLSQATGRPIGVADSQNGQSKRYAGTFEFYCEIMRKYDPASYIEMIHEAERANLAATDGARLRHNTKSSLSRSFRPPSH